LVQQDFTLELLNLTHSTGILSSRCRTIPIGPNSNGLRAPIVDESDRATGSRWGGVRVYRLNETGDMAGKGSKPKFDLLDLRLERMIGVYFATEEMLRDATQLGAIASQAFAEEFSFMLDDEIVRGDGVGKCLGFLNAPALISVTKELNQTADTIVAENVINMYARMPARSKANAIWLMNTECWPQIMQLNFTLGIMGYPLFTPPGGLSAAPYGQILGKPIIEIEQASAIGDVGDLSLVDLSQYILIDKTGINASQSIHVQFLTDETCFKFVLRNNGQPLWKKPLTPYKGSKTVSPFITIENRT
jgi:HK97 family phage major capsid protein